MKNLLVFSLIIFTFFATTACNSQPQPIVPKEQISTSATTQQKEELTIEDYNVLQTSAPDETSRTTDAKWELVSTNESTGQTYITPHSINDIALDEDGVWLATNAGLLFWDLATGNLSQYAAPQTPIPGNYISSLLLDDGELYLATRTGVAIFDREENWQVFPNDTINAEDSYGRPMAMIDDTLWVGSGNGISKRLPNGEWETIGADTFPFPGIRHIEQTPTGIYVEVYEGFGSDQKRSAMLYEDGDWQPTTELKDDIYIAPDGSWWKIVKGIAPADGSAHPAKYLLKSEDQGETWETLLESDDWLDIHHVDESGKAYISRDSDLLVLENNSLDVYRFTDVGPELNYTNHIVVDEENRVWVATDGRGLSMFDGSQWQNWQPETREDMRDDAIRGLAVGNGKVYAGAFGSAASGGLMIYDVAQDTWENQWPESSGACPAEDEIIDENDNNWERENTHACEMTTIGNLSGGGVGGIGVNEENDTVYLATAVGMLDTLEGNKWSHYPMSSTGNGFAVLIGTYDALVEPSGNVLVASDAGIHSFENDTWKTRLEQQIAGPVRSVALDDDGNLWAAANGGLVFIDNKNETPTIYSQENSPLTDAWVKDIVIDSDGTVWGVTNDLLFAFDGKTWETYESDILGNWIWGDTIAIDQDGKIWVEAGDGLFVFSPSYLP